MLSFGLRDLGTCRDLLSSAREVVSGYGGDMGLVHPRPGVDGRRFQSMMRRSAGIAENVLFRRALQIQRMREDGVT